jgi:ElaB/YqjD/DUF883 family membrane-anchored ribosome-binding protein
MNIADPSTSPSGVTPTWSPNQGPHQGLNQGLHQGPDQNLNPNPVPGTMAQDTGAAAAMVTRVVQGAHEAIDSIAEHATPALERLEQGLSQSGEVLHEKAGQLRATGDEWAESLRDNVRQHPLAALAAALAVGVVIARLAR